MRPKHPHGWYQFRKDSRPSLKRQAFHIAYYCSYPAEETVRRRAYEPHEVLAWICGWAPRPRINVWSTLRKMWPQHDIYEELCEANPVIAWAAR